MIAQYHWGLEKEYTHNSKPSVLPNGVYCVNKDSFILWMCVNWSGEVSNVECKKVNLLTCLWVIHKRVTDHKAPGAPVLLFARINLNNTDCMLCTWGIPDSCRTPIRHTICSICHSTGNVEYPEGFVPTWGDVVVFSCSLQSEEEDTVKFISETRMREIGEFVDDSGSGTGYRKEYSLN